MTIKKYSKKRQLSKRVHRLTKKSKNSNKHNQKRNSNKHINKRNNNNRKSNGNKKYIHKGGAKCDLVTIKEPGFSLSGLGDIPGLSIPEYRAAIYRPNCKADTYQAMTP